MFRSLIGILNFSKIPGERLALELESDFLDYYRALMPRYIQTNRPRYSPHVSVIRNEVVTHPELWGHWHGKKLSVHYKPMVFDNELYYWLQVDSLELETIREKLGLTPTKYGVTYSPDEQHKFHITIGNTK